MLMNTLTCYDKGDSQPYRGSAASMYLLTKELTAYFETKTGVHFVAIAEYQKLVGPTDEKQLLSFLTELGIKKEFSIVSQEIDYSFSGRKNLSYHRSTRGTKWEESVTESCKEIVIYILDNDDEQKSIVLWDSLLRNDKKSMEAALYEIRYNVYKKELKKAERMMVAIVEKIEKAPMFQNDKVSEYYTFNKAFEEILYRHLHKTEREIRRAEIPHSEIYLQYGNLLFELRRYQEARAALEKAVRWNSISLKVAFEYMKTFKAVGAPEEFASLTRSAFKYAYRAKDLARCYRNMGYYFVEKMEYRAAMGCYILSMQYDRDSKNAQSELYYIQTETDGALKRLNMEDMKLYSEMYGFPLGADDNIIGLSYTYGKHFMDEGDTELAQYLFEIAYELTEDGEVKGVLDGLK